MDILVSSNLERLVFHATGEDPGRTARLMGDLAEKGSYALSDSEAAALSDFRAGWADEAEAGAAARRLFEKDRYLIDPHTAVAVAVLEKLRAELGASRPTIVAATASPFKFPASVARGLGLDMRTSAGAARSGIGAGDWLAEASGELELAERIAEAAGVELPPAVLALRSAPIVHSGVVDYSGMEAALEDALDRAKPETGL
jgi:threonine synthase